MWESKLLKGFKELKVGDVMYISPYGLMSGCDATKPGVGYRVEQTFFDKGFVLIKAQGVQTIKDWRKAEAYYCDAGRYDVWRKTEIVVPAEWGEVCP